MGVVTIPLLPIIIPIVQLQIDEWRYALPFDSASWRSRSRDEVSGWPTRLRMVDNLMRKTALVGSTRMELTRLLGEPDDLAWFREFFSRDPPTWWNAVYRLGPQRGFMQLDHEWLVFVIGSDDRVQRVAVISD